MGTGLLSNDRPGRRLKIWGLENFFELPADWPDDRVDEVLLVMLMEKLGELKWVCIDEPEDAS